MTKKKTNRYQDLKEKEEEEEEIKSEEEHTVAIKTNAIDDVKNEKVETNIYEISKMTLDEVERFCVQEAEYTPNKKKAMKREEETGFTIHDADLKVSVTSEKDNITSKSELEIDQILYQNELMLVRLEQAELNEDAIRKRQEEKEVEWKKRMKEYEDKLALVDLILAEYNMKIKWEEGGAKVYDSNSEENDKMYESNDSSCDM